MAEILAALLPEKVHRLVRYYGAGLVNTAVGYGLYAAFVTVGFNIYVAQALGHVMGMAFNYFSYTRFAFRGEQGSRGRFVASYALNYVLGVALLWVAMRVTADAYVGCLLSVLVLSMINYFILSRFVFKPQPE
jgi:putative flippase GtrA